MGFTILGVCLFYRDGYFYNLQQSATSLYALYYADNIDDFADHITDNTNFIHTIYIMVFVTLFAMVFNNFIVSILCEAWD